MTRTCSEDGCAKPVYGQNRCRSHWARWYKKHPGPRRKLCTVAGCGRVRVGAGLCNLHYQRARSHGTLDASRRALARSEKTGPDGKRTCYVCGVRKPRTLEFFGVDRRTEDGMRGTCIKCARAASDRWALRERYGLTPDAMEAMLLRQRGLCAVCGIPLARSGKKSTRPHVDHCHSRGTARGLLCHHCNVLIGHARDLPSRLRQAALYLEATSPTSGHPHASK